MTLDIVAEKIHEKYEIIYLKSFINQVMKMNVMYSCSITDMFGMYFENISVILPPPGLHVTYDMYSLEGC